MKSRKRLFFLMLVLIVLPLALLFWKGDRQYHQECLNHALIAAIKAQNAGHVVELLEEGADANAHDTSGVPSFGQMLRQWFDQIRRHKGKTDATDYPSALHIVSVPVIDNRGFIVASDEMILLALLDHHANPNESLSKDGCSVLGWAIGYHQTRVVRRLLQCGTNPNAVAERDTENGVSSVNGPLMYALNIDNEEAELMLLQYGANVNVSNANGTTPLMQSAFRANPKIIRQILRHGAKTGVSDRFGQTVLSYALHNAYPGNEENTRQIIAILKQHGEVSP